MNFNNINQRITEGDLSLRPVSVKDRDFINGLFSEIEIKRYYIVPKEAHQDYRRLVDYWLNDIENGAGACWIIIKKGVGLFASDNQVGFVAFEFRDSIKNARISYAILPAYRRKGLATSAVNLIIEHLKKEGIERIEADIDRDNLYSERVVEKLGFSANKRQALVDPEMMRDGEIRMRTLWKKDLIEFSGSVSIGSVSIGRIPLDATLNQIIPIFNNVANQINTKGKSHKLLIKYFYLLGRIKFLEGNYPECQEAFGHCNMIVLGEGLPEVHETFYWFAKISETEKEIGTAKMYYGFALERFSDDPDYITRAEIELEMKKLKN